MFHFCHQNVQGEDCGVNRVLQPKKTKVNDFLKFFSEKIFLNYGEETQKLKTIENLLQQSLSKEITLNIDKPEIYVLEGRERIIGLWSKEEDIEEKMDSCDDLIFITYPYQIWKQGGFSNYCEIDSSVYLRKSKAIGLPFVIKASLELTNNELVEIIHELLLLRKVSFPSNDNISRPLKKSEIKNYSRLYMRSGNPDGSKRKNSANLAKLKEDWKKYFDVKHGDNIEIQICFYPVNGNSSLVIT